MSGWSPIAHYGFLVLVVFNLVSGFHALGTLMAVGIMILPAASARLWVKSLPALLVTAAGIAFASSVVGLLASFHLDVPAGPAIVLTAGFAHIASILLAPGGTLGPRLYRRHHLEA